MTRPIRLAALLMAVVCASCGAPEEPADDLEPRYGGVDTTSTVEAVAYTDVPYNFTGPTPLQELYDLIPGGNVWYGTSAESEWPVSGSCNDFGNQVEQVAELPVEVEGVVTLHPRYFQKVAFCSSEERYYASYILEDESGGFLVLKDSRIADFTFGDRVKLKVHGLMKYFDTYAVVVFTDEEVVSEGGEIFYEKLDRHLKSDDIGRNVRVLGEIASPPTNSNFNEMCLVPVGEDYSACDPRCVANEQCLGSVVVSVDRELGQRNPSPLEAGKVIEVTGPVVNSFGLRILISRLGQISFVDE